MIRSISILWFFMFISTSATVWGAPVTVHVAEFRIDGANKPGEMKSTIQTLLLSRLNVNNITTQAKPDGANIYVSGSYLVSGSVFSLDAAAANSTGVVIARAFAQGNKSDDLIPAINTLANSLSSGITKAVAATGTASVVLGKSDIIIPVQPAQSAPVTGQVIHKMATALSGLAIGRTLGDNVRELFVIGNHTLRYYRQGAELKLLFEFPYKAHEKVLAVDTADLDNNGVPEIYVTIMNGELLASQVWTVEGATLKKISGPLPYFFRAITGAGGAKKLYAQRISDKSDFSGDVGEVVRSGESYGLMNLLKLPKGAYLYNFSLLSGYKNEVNPAIIDRSGYLRIFTPMGDEIWKSNEEFGGSESFFNRSEHGSESGLRQIFLESRIVVKANGDILVPKNSRSWYVLNKHNYSRNSMFCFKWSGSTLDEKWHTQQSDNYLADYAYDESLRELLLLEVVDKGEGVFDKGSSRLVIKKIE